MLLSLVLLSFIYHVAYSADKCSVIPPSLWCSNQDLITECGFKEHCSRYFSATRNQKIHLTVLIEALCPYCQRWIMDQLYPKIYKNFANFVNIELVPYGNAKVVNGTVVCQHGDEECMINKFESCLIDSVEGQDQYVPLIYCIESNLKNGVVFDKAQAKCFRTYSVGDDVQRMVQSCLVSKLGQQLQDKAAQRTADVWPEKHSHVPWILFNNVSLSSSQNLLEDVPNLICQWWNGDKAIPYCNQEEKKHIRRVSLT